MFFVMKDIIFGGSCFSRRIKAPTVHIKTARAIAIKYKGYILNEDRELVGQAVNSSLPLYIDDTIDIGSGEDCYV